MNTRKAWLRPTVPGAAVLFLLALITGTAFGTPDLVIRDLTIDPPAPLPGANVVLIATVENLGPSDVPSRFFVRFEVDGQSVGTAPVDGLPAGQCTSVSTPWIAEAGAHSIAAEADQPNDRIDETDEQNNATRLDVLVPLGVPQPLAGVRIAVGPFEDRSASGFLNVGEGIADEFTDRLSEVGVQTVDRTELAKVMQEAELNPFLLIDAAAAAARLGADLFVTGSVAGVDVAQTTLVLGAVTVSGGSADVRLTADVVDVSTAEPMFTLSSEGQHDGTSAVKIDFGALLSLPDSRDVCTGGLSTDRDAYYRGEPIALGFHNTGPGSWYGVEIYTSTGTFLRWLGWKFVPQDGCGRWTWDQGDSFGEPIDPSVYVAKLWNGSAYTASSNVLVRPGVGRLPQVEEITVGTESFRQSVVGGAVDRAVDHLVSSLVRTLESALPTLARAESAETGDVMRQAAGPADGQVAAVLPDGRIVITLGASSGVSRGDFFQILSQNDDSLLGEVVAVEVRDHVSYVVKTTDFELQVGDTVGTATP